MVAYGLLYALACTWLGGRLRRRGWTRLGEAGGLFAWFGLGAAAFDALENFGLLLVLGGHLESWPRFAQLAAIAKFSLAALVLFYVLAGALLPPRRTQVAE